MYNDIVFDILKQLDYSLPISMRDGNLQLITNIGCQGVRTFCICQLSVNSSSLTCLKIATTSALVVSSPCETVIPQINDSLVSSTCTISQIQRGKSVPFSGKFQASLDFMT